MKWILSMGLVLVASVASAQSVEANKPYRFVFPHDGLNTTHYDVKVNGTVATTAPVSALVNGEITVQLQGVAAGDYTLEAVAVGPGGATAGQVLAFTAKAPAGPSSITCSAFEGSVGTDGLVVLTCKK